MAISDRVYDIKDSIKTGGTSTSNKVLKEVSNVTKKAVDSFDTMKTKITKDLKGKTIYQDFIDNNKPSLDKFISSVNEGNTNSSLARKIKNGIEGMTYSDVLGKFKFGQLIYSPREKLLKFKSIVFDNVDFYEFLKIVLDGYCTEDNVDRVYKIMKSLKENKIENGFIKNPCYFTVLLSEGNRMDYSVHSGDIDLVETNVDDINLLNSLKDITGGLLPIVSNHADSNYVNNANSNYVNNANSNYANNANNDNSNYANSANSDYVNNDDNNHTKQKTGPLSSDINPNEYKSAINKNSLKNKISNGLDSTVEKTKDIVEKVSESKVYNTGADLIFDGIDIVKSSEVVSKVKQGFIGSSSIFSSINSKSDCQ